MAKTKPIGVRFDEDLLSDLKEKGLATSPQKALNLYEKTFSDKNEKSILEPPNTEEIQKQIAAIKAEKIPEQRNTIYGRKVWQKEQDEKINALQKQLK